MDKFSCGRLKKAKQLTFILTVITLSVFMLFVFKDKTNIIAGLRNIITSPSTLITDFLVIGGLGATFLNAFSLFLFNFILVKSFKLKIDGLVLAAFFTVFGFSFFGKNVFNVLPIYLGGIMYAKFEQIDFKTILPTIMFTSALAPFISAMAFSSGTFENAYLLAMILGIFIGFIATPLAKKMSSFHEGFNLYNLGFTGGLLGAVITSILKAYNFHIESQKLISTNYHTVLLITCSMTFSLMIFIGFYINENSFKGYRKLLKSTGLKSDFIEIYGYGLSFINMGINGFISTGFVLLLGETLNGPFLAGILTIVGFSAYGKHPLNITPILFGVWLAGVTTNVDNFILVLSALFGTAMAPISGVYGPFWGIVAGWLHMSVVRNIGVVHGGLNLYNNGFSAGIVAGVLLPIIRIFTERKNKFKDKYFLKRQELYKNLSLEDDDE
ncbi:MAG: DUF1576 domain-containing protein [Fusobacteria bacterium]|nr:MAG: DUF1576 domain-containing protein [Fusobacteriota bacterium]